MAYRGAKIAKPKSIPKPKPLSKTELWASFGLNRPPRPRYEGLKGIYWHVVSQFVRQRDFKMWQRCISCNKWMQNWEDLQAGHFIAAGNGGFALLFDLRNINGECGGCNGFDQNHLIGYERHLDERYGPGTAQKLKDEYTASKQVGAPTVKAWNDKEYVIKIRELQGALAAL